MYKKSKLVVMISLLVMFALVVAGCGGSGGSSSGGDKKPEAKPVKWVVNEAYPPNNHHSIGLVDFAAKVKEATNGKIEMDVQAGGALGYKGPELLKVVRDGLVPVTDLVISGVAGDEPMFGVVTLPFLVHSHEEARLLHQIARPYFDKVAEEKWNQKILYNAPWPAAGFWAQKELRTLEDMKGLKTRTYDKNGALVMEALGATPYPLPFSEVYSSLATGVIDSVLTSSPTAVDGKFWEVLKYYAPVNVTQAVNMVTVNLDEFNKLDKETQETLIKLAQEMEEEMWAMVAELDKEKEQECNDNGIVTLEPSEELMNDLSEITEGIRADWLKDAPPEAKEIVAKFKEKVGR
ncbi:MAG: TRAP transporter substrate-binding protein [Bacillota bacterium]